MQKPPVNSATLVPDDLVGVTFGGLTLTWADGEALHYEFPVAVANLLTNQSVASFTPPNTYNLFPFSGGTITIGGVAEGNIVGGGSLNIAMNLRTDAHYLGGGGIMAKPVENDKPTASLEFTADFVDNVNLQRMLDDTQADVILKFQHPTAIAATYFPYIEVTLPGCKFDTERAQVDGPGLVDQPVTATAASSTDQPPVIRIMSTETVL